MSDQFVVRLEGGKPWGFTLQGGADFRSPLKIGKVTPGGKASTAGLVAGDYILSINSTSWEGLKHVEAQQLVVAATDLVVLKCTKLMPSVGLQVPKTPQTPLSASFTYGSGTHVPPSPTTTPSPGPTPPTAEGTVPTQGAASSPVPAGTVPTQGATSSPVPAGTVPTQGATSSPVPAGTVPAVRSQDAILAKPPPPPTVKKPPTPPLHKIAPSPPGGSSSDVHVISGEHQEGEEGKPTNEVCSGDVTMPTAPVTTPTAPVTTPTAPVTAPQSTDVPEPRRHGEEPSADKRETLDAMMNHIEDLVSGLVANPPSSSHSPPTSSSASETLATAKANNHHAVEEKIEAAASVMVTKEPGWYKQMLHSIQQTSGEEVFVEDTTSEVYDERGLKIRKSSAPREATETSKRPQSETTPTSTRSPTHTVTPAASSARPRATSASINSSTPAVQRGTPAATTMSKEAVLAASKKPPAGVRAANGSQVDHSKDYWRQKEEAASMEAQKKSEPATHRKSNNTNIPKTIHPLLASEIPQEERKSVSPDQPQQSVFERIEAEKLNKALESSQLMGKLEKEGVPSTLVTAVAADHKEAAEAKQIVKEKKLPPPPAKMAKALYNFEAKTPKELSFKKGTIIDLSHTVDDNWLEGSFEGKKGIFPKAYVKIIPDDEIHQATELNADIPTQFGIAKYDFNGHTLKELSLKKGDIVSILRKVDANWLEGTLNDKKGIFPAAYVEMAEGGDNPTSSSPS
ncbi:hypothetical protein EMCRGX_G008231 [Ephydatia muelleri]